ncbi:WD repeat-containing protein 78 [Rhizophlyctis rosea]|uniref:Dynein axonemal intermediate chain 4 n=1 Tax=Rhizophlyctis rosea TaxID=64517 RepID=A0AAD5SN06_9FUNG|nr:WD repeat-containing protein 78 [Rhizophlyctis rosea]
MNINAGAVSLQGGGLVQVLDEDGNDVTPLSLIQQGRGGDRGRAPGYLSASDMQNQSLATATRETVADVLNNLESMTAGSWNTSVFGKSMMSYSTASRASGTSSPEGERDEDASSVASAESLEDRDEGEEVSRAKGADGGTTSKGLTEADLIKPIHIHLTETDNILLFDVPSVSVTTESAQEADIVKAANARYKELLTTKANNENYVSRGMQTFNSPQKHKDIQATASKKTNAEAQVNEWSIYDAWHPESKDEKDVDVNTKEADISSLDSTSTTVTQTMTSTGIGPASSIPASLATSSHPSNQSRIASNASRLASRSELMSSMVGGASRSMFIEDGAGGGAGGAGDYLNAAQDGAEGGGPKEKDGEAISLSSINKDHLRQSLLIMERAIVGNTYEKKLIEFRNIVDVGEEEEKRDKKEKEAHERDARHQEHLDLLGVKGGPTVRIGTGEEEDKAREERRDMDRIPTLQFLWSYRCELTRGRAVTCMAWNKQNEDILAVSYAETKPASGATLGLVLCWSLKNPEWPERVYKTRSPVTSLDFSKANPNFLACGFADGRIAIYDVRRRGDKSVLDNGDMAGKHRDPVWELKWVERERVVGDEQSKNETLVTVSTDGRVTQWMVRKGLEFNGGLSLLKMLFDGVLNYVPDILPLDLMTLKRVTKQEDAKTSGGVTGPRSGEGGSGSGAAAIKNTAFIARQAGGLCFDFNPKDTNTYIVGTEQGPIHRCSCSYNEQYISTCFGHTGPVHRVKWSPFLGDVFLSCSSDWTVRLWRFGEGGEHAGGIGSGAGEGRGEEGDGGEECVFRFLSGKDTVSDIAWSPTISTMFGCVSTDGRMEIWDLAFSVLDPIIVHSVLDRQLNTILFASGTPCVLTGDDNGAVNVYKLHRPEAPVVTREPGTIQETGGPTTKVFVEEREEAEVGKMGWREGQARKLGEVLRSKNQGGGDGGA